MYKNFLLLSASMHILLNPSLCVDYLGSAKEYLDCFVRHFGEVYGREMISYNVHGLTHLTADASRYGALDNISGFPFENFLGQLKHLVRKPSQPLEQIITHVPELKTTLPVESVPKFLHMSHARGPLPTEVSNAVQYEQLHLPQFVVKLWNGDNCIQLQSDIVLVRNIFHYMGETFVLYQKFRSSRPFFSYRTSSDGLGIWNVSRLDDQLKYTAIEGITNKCVLSPHTPNCYVAIPLLHFCV